MSASAGQNAPLSALLGGPYTFAVCMSPRHHAPTRTRISETCLPPSVVQLRRVGVSPLLHAEKLPNLPPLGCSCVRLPASGLCSRVFSAVKKRASVSQHLLTRLAAGPCTEDPVCRGEIFFSRRDLHCRKLHQDHLKVLAGDFREKSQTQNAATPPLLATSSTYHPVLFTTLQSSPVQSSPL